ncbi:MAG TPA: glycosyltransferase family 4 protein [Bryobacteraceae bacterium]|nr:glycosyltransferase family 4 protein [Bryobacteraceae bacterium]
MRVLHVDTGSEMRGGQWQCLRLVEAMCRDAVLLAPAASPLARMGVERGIAVEPFSVARLVRLGRECDIVHVHDARAHSWAAAAGGAPLVVSRRVAFPVQGSFLSHWKYSRARHYIAVSHCVRRLLLAAGVPEEKISVVYDGVPLPATRAAPECIVAPVSADRLKGSSMAAEAARHAGFEIVFSNDLERDLRRARVFVYISRTEGLGSAILLAMAHGAAVVASRVGGIPEIIEDGRNGVLTENDPRAIARAMTRAAADAERLGSEARRTVAERFTVEAMAEGAHAVYRRVLAC